MVIDQYDNIIHADKELMATYDEGTKALFKKDINVDLKETKIDDKLGLPILSKPTIFEKYGVHCNPKKNNFHRSLYEQYEMRGALSIKQINALRR